MITWKWQTFGALCVILVALLFIVAEVEARRGGGGRGGGRGFSRSGPAAHGSFRSQRPPSSQRTVSRSSMPDRSAAQRTVPSNRMEQGNRDDLKDRRDEKREDRQDYRDEAREDRQDYVDEVRDDREDWYDDHYHRRVGAVLSVSAFGALSCTSSTVIVDGVTYYECGSDWYTRAYSGGEVTYIIVDAPAGY